MQPRSIENKVIHEVNPEGAIIEHTYESIWRLKAEGIDTMAGTDSVAGICGFGTWA